MLAQDTVLVRVCPRCGSERPPQEIQCENQSGSTECGWSLLEEPLRAQGGQIPAAAPNAPVARALIVCGNGHPLDEGDQLCLVCGAGPADEQPGAPAAVPPADALTDPDEPTFVDGWAVQRRLPLADGEPWERFIVGRQGGQALLTLYNPGAEPDPAVHEALRRLPTEDIPELFAAGRFDGRAYDVVELISGGTLEQAGYAGARLPLLVGELGRALASFSEAGLRHRDIRPGTVLVRSPETFDLVVTGFGSARLSDFDLEAVAPLTLTRYSAPEAIVGAVSAASDWWSFGMIVLEQATAGACFDGVNDKAFLIHVVTRGMSLPAGLDPSNRVLLRGLLARDPFRRWAWAEVKAWLAGDAVDAPEEDGVRAKEETGPALSLAGREHRDLTLTPLPQARRPPGRRRAT